ncbi:efflux transporter outer membrane subunit [Aquabacterium sp. J223]|uniref:efflux transporter outer membrane subunit n=1 Tax=Aquabacterium sp. J223 TaxID=2898431 RepID=UPI0021ADD3CA|nr:efflux transporter outer membrane subunit [Aquabacterium sp. J223]UUX95805.1 efflux transporter outer membrane subunit [Aquabacterium sp. J223]
MPAAPLRLDARPPARGLALTALTALGALAMAALLTLAGCAGPGDMRPRAQPLAAAQAGLQPGAAPVVAETWWTTFGDAQLDALVAKALQDHPNLTAAAARLERARAAVAGIDAAGSPQAQGSLEVSRQRFTENGIVPPPLAGSVRNLGTLQAGLSWELDFFGRHRHELQAALGAERAAQAEAQGVKVALAANVARTYFQLGRLQAQRGVADRTLAQRGQLLGLIQQRVRAGLDTHVELRQGEGALPEARQQIEALDEQIALARHALAALTAQPPGALQGLQVTLRDGGARPLPDDLPADLLARRPDVDAARLRVEAAAADLQAARAQFFPSVNLTAFAGFNAVGLDRLLDLGSRQAGVAPALRLPLLDAGRLRANHRGRAADVDAAVAAYNGAVLDAVRDVADQVASLRALQRQRQEQVQAQAAAESAYDLAVQRYRSGLSPYLTVLTAETAVLAQRRAAADLQARTLDTEVALLRALGGGYGPDPRLARAP